MSKEKQINIRVEQPMYDIVKGKAKSEYRTITEVIRELLVKWIKK